MRPVTHHDDAAPSGWLGKPAYFWIALGLGLALLGLYPASAWFLVEHGGSARSLGWSWQAQPEGPRVTSVDPAGPAAGRLQVGDLILAVDDDARAAHALSAHLSVLRAGRPYTVRLVRGSGARDVTLAVVLERVDGRLAQCLPFLLVSLAFFVTGVFVGLVRPDDPAARLCSISSLLSAPTMIHLGLVSLSFVEGWPSYLWALTGASFPLSLAVAYHFYYAFPAGAPRGRGWSAVQYLLYVSAVLVCVRSNVVNGALVLEPSFFLHLLHESPLLWTIGAPARATWVALACVAIVAVILRNYRLVSDPDNQRRMKWVVYGSAAGLVPSVAVWLFIALAQATGRSAWLQTDLYGWTVFGATSLLMLNPLVLLIAVVRHRVFAVEVVLRRGLQHLLARNVLRAALLLPIVILVAGIAAHPNRTVAEILFKQPASAVLIVAGALCLRYREALTRWIDRRFFRESYDRERVLLDLIDDVKRGESLGEISSLVSAEIDAALHPRGVHLFFREAAEKDFRLGYSSSERAALRLRADSELVRMLEARPEGALDFPLPEPALAGGQGEWLSGLGVRLLVPVRGSEELAGVLLLGGKKSEEPYSRQDRRLLEAVAGQIAFVWENTALKRKIEAEARMRREVVARLDRRGAGVLKECPSCGTCFDGPAERCSRDGALLTLSLPVDRVIDGKYRLERLLGRGAMGAVFEATDLRLERRVAVKIMTVTLFGDTLALRRFELEARASARLAHSNITTLYDFGHVPPDGGYLVMELRAGATLRSELGHRGSFAPQTVADWLDQLCEGVKAAHGSGIVHRDLKPENIFLSIDETGRTRIKILDFGLAKLRFPDPDGSPSLTLPGTVLGTLAYMAPEQLEGKPADHRVDVYALGVLAVECLQGVNPFASGQAAAIVASVLHKPVRLEGSSPDVRALDAVLQKCLAKDPARRYATVGQLQRELIPALRRCRTFAAAALPPVSNHDTALRFVAPLSAHGR